MNEQVALAKMISPGMRRPGKLGGFGGVIQIHVTRACNMACFNCTQGSQLGGKTGFMTPAQFRQAIQSLDGYFGVVGVFGGNPATSPDFDAYCEIMRELVPFERRGLWCNHPLGHGKEMRRTFDPRVCNLNVHLDKAAYAEFKRDWPESMPFGLDKDSRHSPPFVAMRDVLKKKCDHCVGFGGKEDCVKCGDTGRIYDESKAWELISGCDINQHWSAMIGVFRGQLRGWFCEIAGAQSILHQDEPDYPDTGIDFVNYDTSQFIPNPSAPSTQSRMQKVAWWQLHMADFTTQVRKHCHDCGVPLRGHGELAQASQGNEQVSALHQLVYKPKRKYRQVELVTDRAQLGDPLAKMTDYMGNAKR